MIYQKIENSLSELRELEKQRDILLAKKQLVIMFQKGILKIGDTLKNENLHLYGFDKNKDYIISDQSDKENGILNFIKKDKTK